MSVQAGVSDVAISIRDKLRGKIGQTKVKRYWPGKAPEWAEEEVEDEEPDVAPRSSTTVHLQKPISEKDDPRLRRLAESRCDKDEAVVRHRQIRHAEIVSIQEEEKKLAAQELEDALQDEDDDVKDERRQRIKAQRLQKQREVQLLSYHHFLQ